MIGMKKLLLSLCSALTYLIISCISTRPCPTLTAQAEEITPQPSVSSYACVLTDDVYLYATKSEQSGLFVLPKTYYVKVLSTADDFCKVEYLFDGASTKKITGYCKTEQLTFVDYIPQTPYFYYLFDLTYYVNPDEKDSPLLDKITVTCAYYGSYQIGSNTYCYVLRGDDFGYVPLPTDFSFVENDEYAANTAHQNDQPAADQTPTVIQPTNPVQIAAIVLLCLIIPIVAALILRQPKKSFYEWEER